VAAKNTVSVILEPEQDRVIREIQLARSTPYAKVSFAAVAREAIAIGLKEILRAPDMISRTSLERDDAIESRAA